MWLVRMWAHRRRDSSNTRLSRTSKRWLIRILLATALMLAGLLCLAIKRGLV